MPTLMRTKTNMPLSVVVADPIRWHTRVLAQGAERTGVDCRKPRGGRPGRGLLWTLAVGAAVLLAMAQAHAQVLEIDAAGNVQRIGSGWESRPVSTSVKTPAVPARYRQVLAAAAAEYGISMELLQTLVWSESGFDPAAVSPAGAIGLMQLMPQTARELGVDPHDPEQNIRGGAAYLRRQLDRFDGDLERALAAYNAGPEQVERHGGVPPFRETQAYVAANLDRLAGASLAATASSPVPLDISGGTQ